MKSKINVEVKQPSNQQLQNEVSYLIAQELLSSLLENNLINDSEYRKITLKNRESFSPILASIMPKIT